MGEYWGLIVITVIIIVTNWLTNEEGQMNKMFIPKWTKKQFVEWADTRYSNNKHSHMKKNQLIKIFINTKQENK